MFLKKVSQVKRFYVNKMVENAVLAKNNNKIQTLNNIKMLKLKKMVSKTKSEKNL